ncbi:MAG: Rrf2 family transcriptional regulator [Clostridiales bacterium]|nr:Rrf2 family transcriptional regulator [Clostridiales bacterium]
MHITLETDYAIRIVSCLAKNKIRMDARSISEETSVTLRFSLKILSKLVASGIIKSFKGTHGGYELAKEAHEITMLEVIETVEGTYYFSRCLADGYECNCSDDEPCATRAIFLDITETVQEKLRNCTFDMLI